MSNDEAEKDATVSHDSSQRFNSYKDIEKYRKRPLIVYATSTRQNVNALLAADVVREFIDQIDAVPKESTEIDILIHSTGGDGLAAWRLMATLRERFDHITVMVPHMAFSAATIFCLGADEIVMHPHASLGPIDPQIRAPGADGRDQHFSYEDVGAFLRFLVNEAEITEQSYISPIVLKLFDSVTPLTVGYAQRASELSSALGERLLLTHMTSPEEKTRARDIAENLNKSFYAHGDAVSRARAKELELRIAAPDEKLEALIWAAFLGIEEFMELRKPFSPLEIIMQDEAAGEQLLPNAPLELPANMDPNMAQEMWQQVANSALNNLARPAVVVGFSVVNALCESPRLASEHRNTGMLFATRLIGGDIQLAKTDKESRWKPVEIPT